MEKYQSYPKEWWKISKNFEHEPKISDKSDKVEKKENSNAKVQKVFVNDSINLEIDSKH